VSPRASTRSLNLTSQALSLLLYDRWDVWDVDPTGARASVNVTDGYGRKNSVTLRIASGGGGFGGGGGGSSW